MDTALDGKKIRTDRRMITQSYWKYTDTPMCNSKDMRKYLKMYVNYNVMQCGLISGS